MTDHHPQALCVLGCRSSSGYPYPADNGYLTCNRCADRLRAVLVEIAERYAVISYPAAALPKVGEPGRQTPGFESKSPASDHIIALRDVRTTAVEPGDPHSPLAILWGWARTVREERDLTPPTTSATVLSESNTLLFHWDWVLRQAWVDDIARELREVVNQLRNVTGEPSPRPIGRCPTMVNDEDGRKIRCDAPLYAPTNGDAVQCRGCGREWPRHEWLRLGQLLAADRAS